MRAGLVLILLAAAPFEAAGDDDPSTRHFDRVIAPLLARHCLDCHSGDTPKGKLDLTSRRGLFTKRGKKDRAIAPGKPDDSLIWQYVEADEMPPKNKLSAAEKKTLRRWIGQGAKWGTDPIDRFRFTTKTRAGYDWWSLQRLREVSMPTAKSAWIRNPIDNFTLRGLKKAKLAPSPPASPRDLIRRVYFDLTGLPPTPEEVAEFVKDPSDLAYRRIVDKLLASPRYGERWGRHWLDVARFGESDGFERNNPRKTAWYFRDWVIRSLNSDMRFDRFARMQIAGDLESPGREGTSAVGFLVAGVHNTVVGSSPRMKKIARQDELEEIVGTVSQTFLGLTVNCARCHDHKFDPIRSEEYYRMISSLDGVAHGERTVTSPVNSERIARLDREIPILRSQIQVLDGIMRKKILQKRKDNPRPEKADLPKPYAAWSFNKSLKDSVGKMHATLVGGARADAGGLHVDGRGAYAKTAPLTKSLREKTLEAWVKIDGLNQRGGGVISLQTSNGINFDAIVYGEREAKRWMAGSDGFRRTKSFRGTQETQAEKQPVHIAIVYKADGTITGYRNGLLYGKAYKTGMQSFGAGKAHVVFGLRHGAPGGNRMLKGTILRANLYDRALSPQALAASAGRSTDFVSQKAILAEMTDAERKQRAEWTSRLTGFEVERNRLAGMARTRLFTVAARRPGEMRVHNRGDIDKLGKIVAPGGVASLRGPAAEFRLKANAPDADRRRKLADWITHPTNPLFVRTIVNRVWHYHFGRGIVPTPNDLGFNGGLPSHPELLEWLSRRLRELDYRLKPLHRMIVLSATYRQSSLRRDSAAKIDAENRLLWRFPPRRIEAEVLRDSMLSVAGLLNPQAFGPGFEDVQARSNNGTTYYSPVPRSGPDFDRRTVYRFTPRGGRSAILDTFDCPDPSVTTPRRARTTTPLQALALLNNEFSLRVAGALATRIERETGKDIGKQITRAYQIVFTRKPTPREFAAAKQLAIRFGLRSLCRGLLNSNEFVTAP